MSVQDFTMFVDELTLPCPKCKRELVTMRPGKTKWCDPCEAKADEFDKTARLLLTDDRTRSWAQVEMDVAEALRVVAAQSAKTVLELTAKNLANLQCKLDHHFSSVNISSNRTFWRAVGQQSEGKLSGHGNDLASALASLLSAAEGQ